MSKSALYSLIAAAMVLGVAAVNHATPRVEKARTRAVPVHALPRTIGAWKNQEDETLDARVTQSLPSATLVSRVYRDPHGYPVQAFLVTAMKAGDYHPPTYCMSAQGW